MTFQWTRVLRAARTITSNLVELVLVMRIPELVTHPPSPIPAGMIRAELDAVFAEHAALAQLDATLAADNFRQLRVFRCYFSASGYPEGKDEHRATHDYIMKLFKKHAPRLYDRNILTVDFLQYVPARKGRRGIR